MPHLACDFEKTDMNVNAPTQTKPSLLICKEEHMYQNTGAKIGNNIPLMNRGSKFCYTCQNCIKHHKTASLERGNWPFIEASFTSLPMQE